MLIKKEKTYTATGNGSQALTKRVYVHHEPTPPLPEPLFLFELNGDQLIIRDRRNNQLRIVL